MKKLQCEMCGNTELEKRGDSYVCSVCGTEYVEAENNDNDDKIETIIFDFTASEKECLLSIKEWLIASDYVPDDILAKAKFEPMKKLFLPMYSFVGNYSANWTADSGYNREEIYTDYVEKCVTINGRSKWVKEPVTKKRIVTDWHPSSGRVSDTFSQLAVAVKGNEIDRDDADFIETNIFLDHTVKCQLFDSFDKKDKNILPYDMDEREAFNLIKPRLNDEIDENISEHIPGDTFRNSKWSADQEHDTLQFYYPIYTGSYEYDGETYSYIVDGRDPERLYGQRPDDEEKIETARETTAPLKKMAISNNILFVLALIQTITGGSFYLKVYVPLFIFFIIAAIFLYRQCIYNLKGISANAKAKRRSMLKILRDESLTDEQKESKLNELIHNDFSLSKEAIKQIELPNNEINREVKADAQNYLTFSLVLPSCFAVIGGFLLLFI